MNECFQTSKWKKKEGKGCYQNRKKDIPFFSDFFSPKHNKDKYQFVETSRCVALETTKIKKEEENNCRNFYDVSSSMMVLKVIYRHQ